MLALPFHRTFHILQNNQKDLYAFTYLSQSTQD